MKKIITLILGLALIQSIHAQKIGFWFDAGLKAGVGPTMMLNKNIFNDDTYDHQFSNGFGVGGKLGVFHGLYNGVTFDFMLNKGTQKFRSEINTPYVEQQIDWTSADLAVLYRLQKEGIYIELGPQFSFINKVEQDGFGPADVSQFYAEKLTSGIFGFGGYLVGTDQFTLMFGLRLGYSFTDFINDEGQDLQYPRASAVQLDLTPYDTYESTNPIFVQLMFEANFGIGYFAKTACAHRTTFFRM